jgi:hypothetical protein
VSHAWLVECVKIGKVIDETPFEVRKGLLAVCLCFISKIIYFCLNVMLPSHMIR